MTRPLRVLCALCLAAAAALGQTPGEPAQLLQALSDQLAAGRHAEALVTARRAAEALPGNPAVWYNLAGLEELHGDRAAALAALQQAVLVGFDDFRFADQDADLGALRDDPGYHELREAWAAGLAARRRERSVTLEAGTWSDPIPLVDRQGGLDPPRAEARLRVTGEGLEVELTAEGRPVGLLPPWRGGSGLLLTVLLPEDPRTGEGRLFGEFGLGMADGVPAGALHLGERWQRLSELTPKFRRDPTSGRLQLSFAVPWTVCDPIHPLVDRDLELNLVWLRAGGDAPPGRAAWIADPAAGRADRPWRRGIPLPVRWTAATDPAVAGRLADRVVRDGVITLEPLVAVGTPGEAILNLRDRDATLRRSETWKLTPDGPLAQRADTLRVDLVPGSARLGVTAGAATWETEILILPRGWEAEAAATLARAPAREQPSLRYRLEAVAQALDRRLARENPAALATTVDELTDLLAEVVERGTSLPAGGSYLAVVDDGTSSPERLCSLCLPAGWRRGDPVRVLLLLARAPGQEQQAVLLAPRLLAERAGGDRDPAPLVTAVAHLGPGHEAAAARREAEQLLDWLRDFVAVDTIHLAGVDLLAATALELAAARPAAVAGVLAITGFGFTPYPELNPGALPAALDTLPADLPAGWIWFPDEQRPDDQAAALRQALRTHGLDLVPERAVAGGLDFSQAWTRAVVWASERGR
jgi:hypothetical protein